MSSSFHIIRFDTIDSTNSEALRIIRTIGSHPPPAGDFVVTASAQTAGRGRHGRLWQSPPGNLYASIALRREWQPELLPQLSFVAGLAMHDLLSGLLPLPRLLLKWPNDIYAGTRKLAGILTETLSCGNAVTAVVIGIGLNLSDTSGTLPATATCLAAEAPGLSLTSEPALALELLLEHFNANLRRYDLDGWTTLLAHWKNAANFLGKNCRLNHAAQILDVTICDIRPDCSLVVLDQTTNRQLIIPFGAGGSEIIL